MGPVNRFYTTLTTVKQFFWLSAVDIAPLPISILQALNSRIPPFDTKVKGKIFIL